MATGDAKYRVASMHALAKCYIAQGWNDEAIDTLRRAIESYQLNDDKLALDLRYLLMEALEASGKETKSIEQIREAQKWGSQILQTDIQFKDIRDRMNALRSTLKDLLAAEKPA
jgi:tetratricopeptide (TPR) repeat protein